MIKTTKKKKEKLTKKKHISEQPYGTSNELSPSYKPSHRAPTETLQGQCGCADDPELSAAQDRTERARKGHFPTPVRLAFPATKSDKTTKQKRTDQYFLWALKQVSSKSTSSPIQYTNRWQITIEWNLSWGRRLFNVQKARSWSHQETKTALIITSIDTRNNSGKARANSTSSHDLREKRACQQSQCKRELPECSEWPHRNTRELLSPDKGHYQHPQLLSHSMVKGKALIWVRN